MARRPRFSAPSRPQDISGGIAPSLGARVRVSDQLVAIKTRRRNFVADTRHGMFRGDAVKAVEDTRLAHQRQIGDAGKCTITLATRNGVGGTEFLARCDGQMEGCEVACASLIDVIKSLPLQPPE